MKTIALSLFLLIFVHTFSASAHEGQEVQEAKVEVKIIIQDDDRHFKIEKCDTTCTPLSDELFELSRLSEVIKEFQRKRFIKSAALVGVTTVGAAAGTYMTLVALIAEAVVNIPWWKEALGGVYIVKGLAYLEYALITMLPSFRSGIQRGVKVANLGATLAYWGTITYFLARWTGVLDPRIPKHKAKIFRRLKAGRPVVLTEGELKELVETLEAVK